MTIGFGHNLSVNGIPIEIADRLLDLDIAAANKSIMNDLPWILNIDSPRRDAIVHLCFWIGIGALLGFKKMLAACESGDWQTAHDEVLNSRLYGDIPERATEVANRLLTGDTP